MDVVSDPARGVCVNDRARHRGKLRGAGRVVGMTVRQNDMANRRILRGSGLEQCICVPLQRWPRIDDQCRLLSAIEQVRVGAGELHR